ncbi:MAG TPA: IS4 family transposase [Saprospiraceae bacterium]|nr:IS4 family transposase [Saprospiraceae bacterium]
MTNINLLAQTLQELPIGQFKSLVSKYKSDKFSKGINSWTHLVSMLFCHLGHANSVRDITGGIRSITGNINHLGIERVPSKSSLSYINKHRDANLFREYYFKVLEHLQHKFTPMRVELGKLKRKLYILDASILPLCLSLFDWAQYRSNKGAAKLHLLLDYDGCLPSFFCMTDGKVYEIKITRSLTLPKGSVITFDKAYLDYEWLNKLDSNEVYFVTRAKANMAFEVITQHISPDHPQGNVLADNDIMLSIPNARKNYSKKLQYIVYLDSKSNKEYIFITSNHYWKAQTVADSYKQRWHIEVFLKQLKQQMCVKSFVELQKIQSKSRYGQQ